MRISRRRFFTRSRWIVFNSGRGGPAFPAAGAAFYGGSSRQARHATTPRSQLWFWQPVWRRRPSPRPRRNTVSPSVRKPIFPWIRSTGRFRSSRAARNQVVVTATLKSDKVEVDQPAEWQPHRNRIATCCRAPTRKPARLITNCLIPPDATLNLRSSTGPMSAEACRET